MGSILESVKTVRSLFDYNPLTGAFIRRSTGGEAGWFCASNGYRMVSINGLHYLVHRLAWYIHTGEQPPEYIDHIDTDKLNNKFLNYRPSTKAQNAWNINAHKDNVLGIKGISVTENSGKLYYRAAVMRQGKNYRKNFEYTDEGLETAIKWLENTRKTLHESFTRN